MTLDRYQELFSSELCYSMGSGNQILLLSANNKLLIEINCIPIEAHVDLHKESESRILVFVYPALNKPTKLQVEQLKTNELMIMIDCENTDRAAAYMLTIDEQNEEAILKISDMPNIGKILISQEEISGIHKKIWRPQSYVRA